MINSTNIQKVTLDSYEQHIDEYIDKKDKRSPARTASYWKGVEYFLSLLPVGTNIFEVGSGSGYDADLIERKGYAVQRSDAVQAFISRMREQGKTVREYDVLSGPLVEPVTAIYANAVLLHFNEEQFRSSLHNLAASILKNGYLCMGMKVGDYEGWREEGLKGKRYFKYWPVDSLRSELEHAGFTVVNKSLSTDNEFVVITAKKK